MKKKGRSARSDPKRKTRPTAADKPSAVKPKGNGERPVKDSPEAHGEFLRPSPKQSFLLALAAGLLITWLVHYSHLGPWSALENRLFYDSGVPLMTTMDAYFYLSLTADHLEGAQGLDPTPLLVSMTATVHRLTGVSLEQFAFYVPPLLGSLMVFLYVLWGMELKSPLTAFIASLAGASSFYWYTRTCIGRFDTDCLNPFFALLILFLVHRFCTASGYKRPVYLIAALFAAYLFSLWWIQVRPLGLFFIAAAYGLSFFLPSSKWEKGVKIGLLGLGILAAVCIVFDLYHFFPEPAARHLASASQHLKLVSKQTGSAFPDVGASIQELQTDSPLKLAVKASGHVGTLVLSLAGLFFLAKRKKEIAVFLAPLLGLALLTFFSRRFLIFFVPLYALGIGYLVAEVVFRSRFFQEIANPLYRYGALGLVVLILFGGGFYYSFTVSIPPSISPDDAALARSIPEDAPRDAVVWSWWDYGYAVEYLSGRKAFVDGGSQAPDRVFISAFPFSCDDPVLARNWIRYFAAHGRLELHRLARRLGGMGEAVSFLKEILSRPRHAEAILAEHGFDDTSRWKAHFFPNKEAYLYMPQDFPRKAYWWHYYGSWDPEEKEGEHGRIYLASAEDSIVDTGAGLIRTSRGASRFDALVSASSSGVRIHRLRPQVERIAIRSEDDQPVMLIESELFDSLVFQLYYQKPRSTPGFEPIHYDPLKGGVWRVE